MAVTIQTRRDTAVNWQAADPTPALGEQCIETDTLLVKVGDGVQSYTNLPYLRGANGVPDPGGNAELLYSQDGDWVSHPLATLDAAGNLVTPGSVLADTLRAFDLLAVDSGTSDLGSLGVGFDAGTVNGPRILFNGLGTANLGALDLIGQEGQAMRIMADTTVLVGLDAPYAVGATGIGNMHMRNALTLGGGGGEGGEIKYLQSDNTAGWTVDAGAGVNPQYRIFNTTPAGVTLTWNQTSWGALSDVRLKKFTGTIDAAVEKVKTLDCVTYRYAHYADETDRVGLIAQQVQAVLPEAVSMGENGYLELRYNEVLPLALAAIKELAQRVQALENQQGIKPA